MGLAGKQPPAPSLASTASRPGRFISGSSKVAERSDELAPLSDPGSNTLPEEYPALVAVKFHQDGGMFDWTSVDNALSDGGHSSIGVSSKVQCDDRGPGVQLSG